jgi:ketosteroid isomerase-like protein
MSDAAQPAYAAGMRSIACVKAKDKAAWLTLFASDALVQDPVGVSPLDPAGQGHRGREAIARFWDMVIAPGELSFQLRESYPCGLECANVATITNHMAGGTDITTDLVIVYRVNEGGLITALKAYWDYSKVEAQLRAALAPR